MNNVDIINQIKHLASKLATKPKNIKPCRHCNKKGCDYCGGTGYNKRCQLNQCINHGCSGDGFCIPDKKEIDKYNSY